MAQELKGIAKMKQARARLVLAQIFFGSAAINLKLAVKNDLPFGTAATDGRTLYFVEEFINECSLSVVEFIVAHEALHCVMLHPLRI
jgi:predicted metal-dependent peptidase